MQSQDQDEESGPGFFVLLHEALVATCFTAFDVVSEVGQLDVDGDGVAGVDDVQDVVVVAHLLFVVGEESKGVLNLFGESEAYDVLHRPVCILDDIIKGAKVNNLKNLTVEIPGV